MQVRGPPIQQSQKEAPRKSSRIQSIYDSSYRSAILETVDKDLKGWANKVLPVNRSDDVYQSHRLAHTKARSSFQSQADAFAESVLKTQHGTTVKVLNTPAGALPEHGAPLREPSSSTLKEAAQTKYAVKAEGFGSHQPPTDSLDENDATKIKDIDTVRQPNPDLATASNGSKSVVPALQLSSMEQPGLPDAGSRVKVHSLQMMPKYNGEIGTVQGMAEDGRVEVLLDSFPDTLTSIKSDNLLPVSKETPLQAAPASADSEVFPLTIGLCACMVRRVCVQVPVTSENRVHVLWQRSLDLNDLKDTGVWGFGLDDLPHDWGVTGAKFWSSPKQELKIIGFLACTSAVGIN